MKPTLPWGLALLALACSDNGIVLGSHMSGGASGSAGGTTPTSGGGSSGGAGGNPQGGTAGTALAGTSGAGSGGSVAAGGTSGVAGHSGAAGVSASGGTAGAAGTAGSAGVAGAPRDECGDCTPPQQICVYQVGGPGPARFLCAEQNPCGAAGACACIVGQGPCTFIPDDGGTTGICQCDNGLE